MQFHPLMPGANTLPYYRNSILKFPRQRNRKWVLRSLALRPLVLWFKKIWPEVPKRLLSYFCPVFPLKSNLRNAIITGNGRHKLTGAIGEESCSTVEWGCRKAVNPFGSFTGHLYDSGWKARFKAPNRSAIERTSLSLKYTSYRWDSVFALEYWTILDYINMTAFSRKVDSPFTINWPSTWFKPTLPNEKHISPALVGTSSQGGILFC